MADLGTIGKGSLNGTRGPHGPGKAVVSATTQSLAVLIATNKARPVQRLAGG